MYIAALQLARNVYRAYLQCMQFSEPAVVAFVPREAGAGWEGGREETPLCKLPVYKMGKC